jgi:intein/homing endonuclease
LLTAKLIEKSPHAIPFSDVCPESFYLDRNNRWRRVDLLIGRHMLFETGKKKANRRRRYDAAIEIKADSEGVKVSMAAIEEDLKKLQDCYRNDSGKLKTRFIVLYRSKEDQSPNEEKWLKLSRKYPKVRLVITFPAEGMQTAQYFAGAYKDLTSSGGNYYFQIPWKITG